MRVCAEKTSRAFSETQLRGRSSLEKRLEKIPKRWIKPSHPGGLLQEADGYYLLALQNGMKPYFLSAFTVCLAYAAEAYLKVLALVEGKNPYTTHSLPVLFGDLSKQSQERITALWNTHELPDIDIIRRHMAQSKEDIGTYTLPQTLRQALEEAAYAFVDWRYASTKDRGFHISMFPALVRLVILDKHPHLRPPPDSPLSVLCKEGEKFREKV